MMYSLLALSLVCNAVLLVAGIFLYLRGRPGRAEKPELTRDASQLLSDLMKGGAVVVTQVIDPSSIFLYSPRDSQK